MKNRLLSFILAALFLLSSASCASGENTETDISAADIETVETEPAGPLDDLGEHDFGGRTYTVLVSGADNGEWRKNPIYGDAENAEIINSERYKRNVRIEDTFGVKIDSFEAFGVGGNCNKEVENSIKTNDELYNSVMLSCLDTSALTLKGYFTDISVLPNITTGGGWWDQRSIEDMTINNKLYHAVSAACTTTYDATFAILFNKMLAENYQIESPYEHVHEGTWTLDTLHDMMKIVSKDLNGDGVMDKEDQYGLLYWDSGTMGITNAAEEYCCKIGSDGLMTFTLETERAQDTLSKFLSMISDTNITFDYQKRGVASYSIFSTNKALFYMQEINQVHIYRDMEADFGILPMPKLNEQQGNYRCTVSHYDGILHAVPHVIGDAEFTGTILEAVARLSEEYVMPAYYETTLQRKVSRDEESSAMLDIIFASRAYDLGWYYSIGGMTDFMVSAGRQDSINLPQVLKVRKKIINKTLEKVNTYFIENQE